MVELETTMSTTSTTTNITLVGDLFGSLPSGSLSPPRFSYRFLRDLFYAIDFEAVYSVKKNRMFISIDAIDSIDLWW